jgi:peptidoglycan/xylan/chitin deacetylase (PgdA/CDA1 family)
MDRELIFAMFERLKNIVKFLLHRTGLLRVVLGLSHRLEKKPLLAVFTFHRINLNDPDDSYLQGYERGITLRQFERQVEAITSYFDIIDLDTFCQIVSGRTTPQGRRPLALLTFDDADLEHAPGAFATLSRLHLPGVAFVPTAFIESDRRFYHLRLTNICNNFADKDWAEVITEDIPPSLAQAIREFLPAVRNRLQEFRRRLIDPFVDMLPTRRDLILDRWENRIGGKYTLGIRCMNWESVQSLAKLGIAVGSHTVNHNKLELLDPEQVRYELAESKRVLELKTGRPVTSICYPEGSYSNIALESSLKAGYSVGFSSDGGYVDYPLAHYEDFRIPRLGCQTGPDYQIHFSLCWSAIRRRFSRLGNRRKPIV